MYLLSRTLRPQIRGTDNGVRPLAVKSYKTRVRREEEQSDVFLSAYTRVITISSLCFFLHTLSISSFSNRHAIEGFHKITLCYYIVTMQRV